MKKLFLILLSLTVIYGNPLFSQQFILNGKIMGQDTGYIHLWYYNQDEDLVIDSAKINQGNFIYAGFICYPQNISVYRTENGKTKESASVYAEPNRMHIVLKINQFDSAVITGSKTQDEFRKLNFSKKELREQDYLLYNKLRDFYLIYKRDTTNKIISDSIAILDNKRKILQKQLNKIDYDYIIANPDSYLSTNLLWGLLNDLPFDSVTMLYSKITNRVKNSEGGKIVTAFINSSEGGTAADFSETDVNGKLLTLSSFKNKNYVLLDFWASWCVPCRENNPHLISLYNKYHSKGLEIIGISRDVDKDIDKWKKAIQDDGISIWHQVREHGKAYAGSVSPLYAVGAIPVKVLIDKNGKILYRDEANNEESKKLLDKKLAEIFGF